MGTWSSNLYGNDTTCDVRGNYMKYLQVYLLSSQEAYDNIMETYHNYVGNEESEPLFWYALAETQWKVGRLTDDVKNKALNWIEKKGGIELWEESANGKKGWLNTLEKLKIKLNTEQRKEKKFKRIIMPNQNPWNLNDVYAYRIHTDVMYREYKSMRGKYVIMQKIGECKSNTYPLDTVMQIQVFDRFFDDIPSTEEAIETVHKYRLLPITHHETQISSLINNLKRPDKAKYLFSHQYEPIRMSMVMEQYKNAVFYPKNEMHYLTNIEGPLNKQHMRKDIEPTIHIQWQFLDKWLAMYLMVWQGIDYETIGDGTFEYPSREQQVQIRKEILGA